VIGWERPSSLILWFLSGFSFEVQTMRFVIKSALLGVTATAVVLCEGLSGHSLKLSTGQEIAKLSFEEPVRVGGPIWARVELPNNSYGTVQSLVIPQVFAPEAQRTLAGGGARA